jgi:hypothetical protein
MGWSVAQFPRKVRDRIERAIDDFESKDDSQWSNIRALQALSGKDGSENVLAPIVASWKSRRFS